MSPVGTVPGQYQKVYRSHNDHKIDENRDGVCMAASARWCKSAMSGKFLFNPIDSSELDSTKKLTVGYLNNLDSREGRPTLTDIVLSLAWLLRQVGLSGYVADNMRGDPDKVIRAMRDREGTYLIRTPAHVIASSTVGTNIYYYDVEHGLWRCFSRDGWEAVIGEVCKPIMTWGDWQSFTCMHHA